ncbi:MAG: TRAP transporter large permease subunit [Ahniella sp.]|nr:TRAP transporter large permease subunit [Ahniella sp.]
MTWLIVALIIALAAFGAPLFALIAALALLGLHLSDYESTVLAVEFNRLAESPVLIAIPLFTIAGYLLSESGSPKRLVRVTEALFGWLHGGLAVVAILACAVFTAFTGASGVTILAIGALLHPALREAQYSERFSLGLVTTSGSLGLLFFPAVPLILYGIVVQSLGTTPTAGVEDMIKAGVLPGLLMLSALAAYSMYAAPKRAHDRTFSMRELTSALWDARYELPLPVFVLGGVFLGFFAASEAAALTAAYVLIVTVVVRREISLKRLPSVLREAMELVGAILLILGVSLGLTYVLIDAGVPERIFGFVNEHVSNKWAFLALLNVFLLVLGMLLDIFSATVIMAPILVPIAISYGIHPAHLGVIFLANMQLGYFTPPVGMNLFIASFRFKTSVLTLTRACVPFFFVLLACVLIITYWPGLSLGLLNHSP